MYETPSVPHTGPLIVNPSRCLQLGEQMHFGEPDRITHFLPVTHSTSVHDPAAQSVHEVPILNHNKARQVNSDELVSSNYYYTTEENNWENESPSEHRDINIKVSGRDSRVGGNLVKYTI